MPLPQAADPSKAWKVDEKVWYDMLHLFFRNPKPVTVPLKKDSLTGAPYGVRDVELLYSLKRDFLNDPITFISTLSQDVDKYQEVKLGLRIQTDKFVDGWTKNRVQGLTHFSGMRELALLRARIIFAYMVFNIFMQTLQAPFRAAFFEEFPLTFHHNPEDGSMNNKLLAYSKALDYPQFDRNFPELMLNIFFDELQKQFPKMPKLNVSSFSRPLLAYNKRDITLGMHSCSLMLNGDIDGLQELADERNKWSRYAEIPLSQEKDVLRGRFLDFFHENRELIKEANDLLYSCNKDSLVYPGCVQFPKREYLGLPSGIFATADLGKLLAVSHIYTIIREVLPDDCSLEKFLRHECPIVILSGGDDNVLSSNDEDMLNKAMDLLAKVGIEEENPPLFLGMKLEDGRFLPRVSGFIRKLSPERPLSDKALPSVGLMSSFEHSVVEENEDDIKFIIKSFSDHWIPIEDWKRSVEDWDELSDIPAELAGMPAKAIDDILSDPSALLWKYSLDDYPSLWFISITSEEVLKIFDTLGRPM